MPKVIGRISFRVSGTSNEQFDGSLRLLADRSSLNNRETSDTSIGKVGKDNHIVRAVAGLQPTVSDDCNVLHPTTMVGLKKDKVVEGDVTEDFERKGFTWTNKEKTIPSPFHIPEDDELTGDRKLQWTSSLLTTSTYNLDLDVHHTEAKLQQDVQTQSREGKHISAPAYL